MKIAAASLLGVALVIFGAGAWSAGNPRAATPKNETAGPTIYVAQASAGSGSGTGCVNAKSATFFNTPSNWGPDKPIAPGTVVGLCGTITSTLTAQRSGASGKPVTIYFTSGARISQPACGPCIDLDNRSFITVDGGTNGVIEGTNNGSNLGLHQNSTGIHADPCDNCVIKNLTIRNIYVHACCAAEIDQTLMRSIYISGSNLTISHNVVHDAGWSIFVSMNDGDHVIHVDHNNIYNVDHGFITSSGIAGGSFGPIWFNNNHVHDFQNWDTDSNAYHHDGIHCYTAGTGGNPMHISDFYIYDNRFDGSIGGNATAWIFLEGNSGPYATPCADSTSNIWLFNNVGVASAVVYNGVWAPTTGRVHILNNTGIGPSSTAGVGMQTSSAYLGPSEMKNNVFSGFGQFLGVNPNYYSGSNVDYNTYANGNGHGNGWYCNGFQRAFAQWQACVGGDSHGQFIPDAKLNPDGSPQAGSRLLGAGMNLTCAGNLAALCSDITGALRPIRMAPDAGAYQRETAAIAARAIGRARIGASQESVEQFYGQKRAVRSNRPLFGVFDIRDALTSTYHLHRGTLAVSYVRGRAVAVSTTSQYYTTTDGFGVGAPADANKLARSGWLACGRTLVKRRGGVSTAIYVARGLIAALTVSRSDNLHCA